LFAFVFSSGCVYLCFIFPSTFDECVPILDFYLQGLLSFSHTLLGSGILVTRRPLPQALAWFEGMGTKAVDSSLSTWKQGLPY
jgi:hypothetical protein